MLRRLNIGRLTLSEVSGSLGDLGILVPLLVGMAHQGSIRFVPALFFAGLWNLVTGLLWDVPMCVQPMSETAETQTRGHPGMPPRHHWCWAHPFPFTETIAAVALADGLTATQVSLAGMFVAVLVLLLGLTRGVVVVNNAVPVAVVRGLQLGLGLSLVRRGLALITQGEIEGYAALLGGPAAGCVLGGVSFAAVLLSKRWPRLPIALLLFLFGLALAAVHIVLVGAPFDPTPVPPIAWALSNATGSDAARALFSAALPQLPLTTLNSIVSVCHLSRDLFPSRAVSQTSVALSVGLMNLVGCALGGMPVCHGAGGLAAQHHFGARRGVSMVFLGGCKVLLSLTLGGATLSLLDAFPHSVMGVLLVSAGLELAHAGSKLDSEYERTVGLITAGATLSLKTGFGCAIGLAAALLCGGYADVYRLAGSGQLSAVLLRGVTQPLLARYQPPEEGRKEEREEEAGAAAGEAERGGGGGQRVAPTWRAAAVSPGTVVVHIDGHDGSEAPQVPRQVAAGDAETKADGSKDVEMETRDSPSELCHHAPSQAGIY